MADVENTTLGRGDLYFMPEGASGYDFIGNTPSFGLTVNTEYLKHFNSGRGVKTQDRETPVQTDYAGSFMTDNVTPKNLANYFQGDTATIAVAGAVAVVETFVSVVKQGRYFVAKKNIATVIVKVGVTAKVLGTDYEVDAARGMVTVLEAGTIAAGATIEVTYDVLAHSYKRTRSGASVKSGKLLFVAYNPEGDQTDYKLDDVKLSPAGEFAIKADEWQSLPFNIAISTPSGGYAITANGEPYTP